MENEKKNCKHVFFQKTSSGWNRGEMKKEERKKNFGAENMGWATAQLYCKGWRYCIVSKDCIAA